MRELIKKYWIFILAILCLVAAVFLENGFFSRHPGKQLIQRFQERLIEKEITLTKRLSEIATMASDPGFCDNYLNAMAPYNNLLEGEGTGFLIYRNGKLFYWSDRAIAFRDHLPLSVEPEAPVVRFPNGYYLLKTIEKDSLSIFGLILLKTNYSHENQHLKNSFLKGFKLPDSYRIVKAGATDGYDIKNQDGEPVFAIQSDGEAYYQSGYRYLPGILYLTALLLILVFARKTLSGMNGGIYPQVAGYPGSCSPALLDACAFPGTGIVQPDQLFLSFPFCIQRLAPLAGRFPAPLTVRLLLHPQLLLGYADECPRKGYGDPSPLQCLSSFTLRRRLRFYGRLLYRAAHLQFQFFLYPEPDQRNHRANRPGYRIYHDAAFRPGPPRDQGYRRIQESHDCRKSGGFDPGGTGHSGHYPVSDHRGIRSRGVASLPLAGGRFSLLHRPCIPEIRHELPGPFYCTDFPLLHPRHLPYDGKKGKGSPETDGC